MSEDISFSCPKCSVKLRAVATRGNTVTTCPQCKHQFRIPPTADQIRLHNFVITTTQSVDGKTISRYLGIVSANIIEGMNIWKDLSAEIRDIVGGRSKEYEDCLLKAQDAAVKELKSAALKLEADAVIGVSFHYEYLGEKNTILMVNAIGTAVEFLSG